MQKPTNALQARMQIDRMISAAAETDHSWFGLDSRDIVDRLDAAYAEARQGHASIVEVPGAERTLYIQKATVQMALYGRRGR